MVFITTILYLVADEFFLSKDDTTEDSYSDEESYMESEDDNPPPPPPPSDDPPPAPMEPTEEPPPPVAEEPAEELPPPPVSEEPVEELPPPPLSEEPVEELPPPPIEEEPTEELPPPPVEEPPPVVTDPPPPPPMEEGIPPGTPARPLGLGENNTQTDAPGSESMEALQAEEEPATGSQEEQQDPADDLPEINPELIEAANSGDYVAPPNYTISGRGLIYNCKEKHWACVNKLNYFICHANQQALKDKKAECVVKDVYGDHRDCMKVQQYYVNNFRKVPECGEQE